MKSAQSLLWKATAKNFLFSIVLMVILLALMIWSNITLLPTSVLIVSLAASTFGVTYILSVRNPQNYTGFYPGILSSALLGVQFLMLGNYNLALLYFILFIPFQAFTIYTWRRGATSKAEEPFNPKFLTFGKQALVFFVFLLIIVCDFALSSLFLPGYSEAPFFDRAGLKLLSGAIVASSIFGNLLMIRKLTDTWIYWVLFSIVSIALSIVLGNWFNTLLFSFFLVINASSFVAWLRLSR